MTNSAKAGALIVRLSAKHDVNPFGVIALLAIHALVEVDFSKLAFWKDVSGLLRETMLAA